MISYKITHGSLPDGVRISEDGGKLNINGVAPLGEFFDPPTFVTAPGRVAVFDEGEEVELQIEANAGHGKELVSMDITRGRLPYGVKINASGYINGLPAEQLVRDPFSFLPEDAPTWKTPRGTLVRASEFEELRINMAADGADFFWIPKGHLPPGIALSYSGTLEGVTQEAEGEIEPSGPGPVWDTPRGRQALVGEGDTLNLSLTAFPRSGDTISYRVVSGSLPYGAKMDASTGGISGVVSEILETLPDETPGAENPPVVTGGNWTGKVGVDFTSAIAYTIPSDRSLSHITVLDGAFPYGLTLDGTNVTGKPLYAGSYSATIVVVDSNHNSSIPATIHFEVTI